MRILVITSYFHPENFRITDLALGLRRRGHEVTVLTGVPDYPSGRFYPGYGLWQRAEDEYEGVRVVRFPKIPRGKGRAAELALNYMSAAVGACATAVLRCRAPYDVIFVCQTSPVTIGLPAALIRRLRGIPVVFWVLDLWPESLAATGAVRWPPLLAATRRLVRFIYGRCDRMLVSSRGFVRSIEATGGYRGEVTYLPNWVEPEYLATSPASAEPLPAMPEGFRIMFAGNIGAAQDFDTILATVELLRDHRDIHWIIVGDGRRAPWLRQEVERRGLKGQCHLLGSFPAARMPAFFASADAMLVTLRAEPIFALTVPGKLQSYIACGRPVLAALDGEGAELVRLSGAGLTCKAQSPSDLANIVLRLRDMQPAERQAMGARGRSYSREHFDRDRLFDRIETVLADARPIPRVGLASTGQRHANEDHR